MSTRKQSMATEYERGAHLLNICLYIDGTPSAVAAGAILIMLDVRDSLCISGDSAQAGGTHASGHDSREYSYAPTLRLNVANVATR